MTHFLHIEHMIFRFLLTIGSLSLGEKWERGIVFVNAKQEKRNAIEICYYKMLEMGGGKKRLLSLKCK